MNREIYIRMAGVEDDHWWFSGRRAIVESLLARIGLPRDAAILEPGCGTGGNLRMLARCGSVCAMDLDDQACRFAQARGIGEVAAGRLPDKIPFGDRCFDLVVMTDVLEHLDDDAATLRALRERLKPGGLLLLTVPAFRFLWSSHDTSHHHRRRYRAEELRKVVSEAGYEICYLSYYNFLLFTPILATRMVQRLTGANREGHDLRLPAAGELVVAENLRRRALHCRARLASCGGFSDSAGSQCWSASDARPRRRAGACLAGSRARQRLKSVFISAPAGSCHQDLAGVVLRRIAT